MKKKLTINSVFACAAALMLAIPQVESAPVTLDDFNVNEGHFAQLPNASGSVRNIAASSTADRITTNAPVEGAGHQKIVLNPTDSTNSMVCRFLSGGGSPANNTAFTTSEGTDGWLGVYIKTDPSTTSTNWTVQFWAEGASNNGSKQKYIIPDGQWHLYEWNLDDTSGGVDGWGDIEALSSGSATVAHGSHTLDSIIFRNVTNANNTVAASGIFYMDFIARNDSGSVSNLLLNPCLATTGVLVNGPLSTNSNQVLVTGVSGSATELKVYQNTGLGMVPIGTNSVGVVAGNNFVTVVGLVKNAQVAATQKISGQESCVPTDGILVGGGANPSVRIAMTIRETTNTGPVGASATAISSGNLHFLGASAMSGGAPVNAEIFSPSTNWQTITLGGRVKIGNSANAVGTVVAGTTYNPQFQVAIRVYAFKTVDETLIFSPASAESPFIGSGTSYSVNWTWDAVPGAEGYRVLKDYGGFGFEEYIDVTSNSLIDDNAAWTHGTPDITPASAQLSPSIVWLGVPLGGTNVLNSPWGILESINFAIDSDVGPFDLYIDNLQNGSTVFQTFETVPAGTADYAFRSPSNSGTTSGGLLTAPNLGIVTNSAADTGTNSFRVRFQWNGTNASKWLRLTTSGAGAAANPLVNLDNPISFRLLMLPVGATLPPVGPPGPISIARDNGNVILSWPGTATLQSSTDVAGPYNNVGGATSPHTNAASGQTFYRLLQ